MRIAITGSTGLVGSKCVEHFLKHKHRVLRFVRQQTIFNDNSSFEIWDPNAFILDQASLESCDCVIHLSGANISNPWTAHYKKEILSSRVNSTRFLSQILAQLKNKPKAFISASAIGIYGNHESHVLLDESSPQGKEFLADVCRQWEEETFAAEQAGIRVVQLRLGVVLAKEGGALKKMLPIFKKGLGGKLGDGKQMMSWIALSDIPRIIEFIINNERLKGEINAVSPQAVSNQEFTKILGQVIKRPTIFPVPGFAVRMMFGEMGQTLLLEGAHVFPKKLIDAGFKFEWPGLKSALENELRNKK